MTDNDTQLILAALTRIEQRLDTLAHDLQQAKTRLTWSRKREKKQLKESRPA